MEKNKEVKLEEGMVDINTFLKDPALVNKLNIRINKYNSRPSPKGDLRYKRNPEDRIKEAGNFNALWFIDEFLKTLSKTSTLPTAIRKCVEVYVVTSMQELYYENLIKKAKENGNEKKSRD